MFINRSNSIEEYINNIEKIYKFCYIKFVKEIGCIEDKFVSIVVDNRLEPLLGNEAYKSLLRLDGLQGTITYLNPAHSDKVSVQLYSYKHKGLINANVPFYCIRECNLFDNDFKDKEIILVRNTSNDYWKLGVFKRFERVEGEEWYKSKYICYDKEDKEEMYNQAIPYEGNENILFSCVNAFSEPSTVISRRNLIIDTFHI